jgi:hypothetical protein
LMVGQLAGANASVKAITLNYWQFVSRSLKAAVRAT